MGTVSLPLQANVNGRNYRLTQAYVHIWGPSYADLSSNTDAGMVSVNLPTGDYTAALYSWRLERQDETGLYGPVSATLMNTHNYFTVANGTTSTLVFQFETDGVIVIVGSGRVNVTVAVAETAPNCTPLGDDCGFDAWCPPAGLTGRSLQCYPAGLKGVGDSCYGPGDCSRNTTCIDLGSGPVCTALCGRESIGSLCGPGVGCFRCRADYGVCLPTAEDAGAIGNAPSAICSHAASDGGAQVNTGSLEVDSGHWW